MERSDLHIKKYCNMRIISFLRKTLFLIFAGIISSVEHLFSAEEMDAVFLDVNIDYSNDPFYSKLWFWIIIASILTFLLILLIRGGGKKNKSRHTDVVE